MVFSQESRKLSTFNIHTQGSPLCQQHFYSLQNTLLPERAMHLDFGVHSPNNKNNDYSPCWTLPVHIRWSSIVHFLLFLVVLNPFQSSLVFASTSSGLAVLAIFFCSYVRRFQFLIQAIILGIWSWPSYFSEDTSQDLYPCIRVPRVTWRLSQLQPFSIWTTHRTTTEPWSRTAENPSVSKFLVSNFFNLKVYSDFV